MSARSRNLWRGYRWRESAWTRARAAMALGMVLGLGSVGTMAKWSQTVTAETGLFSSAAVNLLINGETPSAVIPGTANLARGGTAAGIIELKNDDTRNLKYTMDLDVAPQTIERGGVGQRHGNAESLRQNMTLTIRKNGTLSGSTCTGGTLEANQSPPATGTGVLATRALNGTTTDSYCVQVTVGASAPVQSRMAQVGYTFTFNANIA